MELKIPPQPAGPIPFPSGKKYKILLADPPWTFKSWSKKGTGRSADQHYDVMTLDDICSLPVADLMEKDSVLFLWTTWSSLCAQEPFKVIEAWGFKAKCCGFLWRKLSSTGAKPHMGMGFYTRTDSEPCILATRGKPGRPIDMSIRQVIEAPVREHSRKPEGIHERIDRLYSGPKLELFARQRRPGWDVWGNEVDKYTAEKGI